ncbi:MAG: hypothetical protein AAF327_02345 [Cyanobacteria bacterium P01_A01_bin.37]
MDSSYCREESITRSEFFTEGEYGDNPSVNTKPNYEDELTELKNILNRDLTPNKRAIIETLIYSWETKFPPASQNISKQSISVEKKKSENTTLTARYPSLNKAS